LVENVFISNADINLYSIIPYHIRFFQSFKRISNLKSMLTPKRIGYAIRILMPQ